MSFKLHTLKKRADFLRARNGRYYAAPGLVLQACRSLPPASAVRKNAARQQSAKLPLENHPLKRDERVARFGFTATKKLGNAVVRNRIKRRLREAVRQIAPQKAHTGYEYVLIGRKSTLKRPFSCLLRDLTLAFAKVHGKRVHAKRVSGKNRPKKRQNS